MPYISDWRRKKFDFLVEELQQALSELGRTEGDLNYVITRLVTHYFIEERRYSTIAKITGILDNVESEFYRRIAVPYEDDVKNKNGDIPEFLDAFKD